MKRLSFIMIALTCALTVHAQQSKDDYKTMVDSAVTIMYTQVFETSKKQHNEHLYLLNEQDQPLNYIPSSSKFKLINLYDDQNRKIIKEGIYAWKVFTTLNKNKFVITIVDFYITYKDHNYSFGNGGGSTTVFEFFCDKNEWRLISFKNQGI